MIPLMVILASKLLGDVVPPQIRLGEWLSVDQYTWVSGDSPFIQSALPSHQPNSNYQSILVPSNVDGLSIICNASYPIQWDFTYDNWDNGHLNRIHVNQLLKSTRKAKDMFDKSTFEFIEELQLKGADNGNTGNYTCRSTTDPEVVAAIFVFWAGNSPPYLLHAGKNKTIFQGAKSTKGHFSPLILPCTVSAPEVKVVLQKERNTTWQNVDWTQNEITYEPQVGFELKNSDTDTVGQFKCVVDDDDGDDADHVYIDVRPGEAPNTEEFREVLKNNATFAYDQKTFKFSCCSDNWKPPRLQLLFCEHPTLCFIRKQTLGPVKNMGQRIPGSSCSNISVTFESSGLIRCSGHGVRIEREFFFPLGSGLGRLFQPQKNQSWTSFHLGKPYYHWSDAEADKMISITTNSEKEMFSGQTVQFYCHVTSYYFANGAIWSWTWKNNSRLVRHGYEDIDEMHFRTVYVRTGLSILKLPLDINMTSVTCSAPVWNSTKWLEKTIQLNIKEPKAPKLDNMAENEDGVNVIESVSWFLNDTKKSLNCSIIEGKPTPSISWQHDGKNLSESSRQNNTSILSIDVVHVSSHGDYTCRASNLKGVAVKKFHVKIIGRKGSRGLKTSYYLMGGIIVGVIIILIGVGLLTKRLRSQAVTISHLKTVAFKDVIGADNHLHTNNGYGFNYSSSPPSIISTQSTISIIDTGHQHGRDQDDAAIIENDQEQQSRDRSVLNTTAFNVGSRYHKF